MEDILAAGMDGLKDGSNVPDGIVVSKDDDLKEPIEGANVGFSDKLPNLAVLSWANNALMGATLLSVIQCSHHLEKIVLMSCR